MGDWRGWKYYCQHRPPKGYVETLWHTVRCGKTPITLIDKEDCVEGCGCIWDRTSAAYWRNHIPTVNQQ